MAEFSKEWVEMKGHDFPSDFSIKDIYNGLSEGETYPIICEGLGITGIVKQDGDCLLIKENKLVSYAEICT
jgi:hypothetical protein